MRKVCFFAILVCMSMQICGQILKAPFKHPGLNHSMEDLERLKQKVLGKETPWIDGWNVMCNERDAQPDFTASPKPTVGGSDGTRQRASRDATSAYYNILRWFVTGNEAHAVCAVNIINAWTNSINEVVTGELLQLPIKDFIQAAELVRMYSGWKEEDREKFKKMCRDYFYPACLEARLHAWPGWGGPANSDCLYIGIFLDDEDMVNDAIEFYKTGKSGGCITEGIQFGGQPVEMGRDQPHVTIGIDSYAEFCQALWNQGVDLFSYEDNLLLKGFEYYAKYNLGYAVNWNPVDYYGHKFYYPAPSSNSPGSMPNFRVVANELVYHHYVDRKGLDMPYLRKMMKLKEVGILTGSMFTFSDTTTAYIPYEAPPVPQNIKVSGSLNHIRLDWDAPEGDVANGYDIQRSEYSDKGFVDIGGWSGNTTSQYYDFDVANDHDYYYRIRSKNQSGFSEWSTPIKAVSYKGSGILPAGWVHEDIGLEDWMVKGETLYDKSNNNTFVIKGSGRDIYNPQHPEGNFTYISVTGDFELVTRIYDGEQNASQLKEKFGIMLRENTSGTSQKIMLWLGDNGTRFTHFIWRGTSDGGGWIDGSDHSWIPIWLKLNRSNDVFTAYVSDNGNEWYEIGTAKIPFPKTCLAGLWVCGGATRAEGYTVSFDNTTLTSHTALPSAPDGFKAVKTGSTEIELSWNKTKNVSGFDIYRSDRINGEYVMIAGSLYSPGYTDTNLTPSKEYFYKITAANAGGRSIDSTFLSVVTTDLRLPNAPSGLSGTAKNEYVALKWNPTGEMTEKYNIYRKMLGGIDGYELIAETDETFYNDETVENGNLYYYQVAAVNKIGEGRKSTSKLMKPVLGDLIYLSFNGNRLCNEWDRTEKAVGHDAEFATGKFSESLLLDKNKTAYITLPYGINSTLSDFTFACWIKPITIDTWARIFDFGNGENKYMFMSVSDHDGKPRFGIKNGGEEETVISSSGLNKLQWNHLVVSKKDSVVTIYINGKKTASNEHISISPDVFGNLNANYIGKSQFNVDPYLNAYIDELRIYNQALNEKQIIGLYNAREQELVMDDECIKRVDDEEFSPATASSGLLPEYESSDKSVAYIYKGMIKIIKSGTTDITAYQSGNIDFVAALPKTMHLVVNDITSLEEPNSVFSDIKIKRINGKLVMEFPDHVHGKPIIELFDINGIKIKALNINTDRTIQIAPDEIKSGVYMIKITCNEITYIYKLFL